MKLGINVHLSFLKDIKVVLSIYVDFFWLDDYLKLELPFSSSSPSLDSLTS